jgi:hypothetical protein
MLFLDVPGTGRYLVKRVVRYSRLFRVFLNGVDINLKGSLPDLISQIEQRVTKLDESAEFQRY